MYVKQQECRGKEHRRIFCQKVNVYVRRSVQHWSHRALPLLSLSFFSFLLLYYQICESKRERNAIANERSDGSSWWNGGKSSSRSVVNVYLRL